MLTFSENKPFLLQHFFQVKKKKIVSDNEKIKMIVVSKTYRFMAAIKITENRQM